MHRIGSFLRRYFAAVSRYRLTDAYDDGDDLSLLAEWRAGPVQQTPWLTLTQATETIVTQATNEATTKNPDAEILAMARRHDELRSDWDRLPDDHPRIAGICAESIELAHRILIFPVRTDRGLIEKRRIVEIENLEIESNHCLWKTGSDFVEFIYKLDVGRILDAERIAAAA